MLTQLQLEGPQLEPLLARVRNELGPHARIVHAEKVRSGGVAGFFAHQRFELTVEVDASLPRTPPPPPVPAPAPVTVAVDEPASRAPAPLEPAPAPGPPAFTAIAGLADDEDEPSLFTALAGLSTAPAAPATPAMSAPAGTAAAAAHAYAPQAAAALPPVPAQRQELPSVLAAALDGRPVAPPPPPRAPVAEPVALDAAPTAFAPYAAFAGVVDTAGPATAQSTTAAPAAAAPTTAAPAEPPASVLELAERVSAEETGAVDAPVSTEGASFAELLSRLGEDIGALGDDVHTEPPAAAPPTTTDADTGVVAVRPAAEVAVPATTPIEDGPAAELARLGLPSHLRPTGVGEALHTALRASLSRLPTAPPAMNRAGAVLAVVGPLAQALHVARQIAEELGLPAGTSVAVATAGDVLPDVAERQVLHGAAEAAERRSTWRRRSNLTVVAVDAPLTASGAADARAFLTALSPTATWGVVEATRKAQDVGSWTRALGGVHALALTDLEETSDPAAVLELGIPVSRLGGRPATPRAWATLLTGRLAA